MAFRVLPVTAFAQNCTLFWCEKTKEAAVIDPGGEVDRILEAAQADGLKITKIWVTHGHLDHVGGVAELQKKTKAIIEGPHEADRYWVENLSGQARMFGFPQSGDFQPDRWLSHGETVTLGEETLHVIHCPGHTPGHVVFYDEKSRWAQVGDVLFSGSIGRTDFPGGSYEALIESIRGRLFSLGDDVQFVPGHGPMSTFAEERRSNPFVGEIG